MLPAFINPLYWCFSCTNCNKIANPPADKPVIFLFNDPTRRPVNADIKINSDT